MKVLVAGGAGYIGSHTVVELAAAGMEPVIVDNFSNSRRKVLERLHRIVGREVPHYEADVTDKRVLERIFARERPEAVIHFAGLKAVDESVAQPLRYYHNNVVSTMVLAEVMAKHQVKRIVFSSSATVYGDPRRVPVTEDQPLAPVNPYGWTKAMSEQILRDVAVANPGWGVALLRYFNPVGAHPSGLIGEDPQGAPDNLMPYVAQVAVGRREFLRVFGDNKTPDGTGIRDYLHVVDLARAHVKALEYQREHAGVTTFNLGTGKGYSVMEVLRAFERACGKTIPYRVMARRPGDVDVCYADPTLAERRLGWKAAKSLDDMCADSWRWQSQNPQGYRP
ncbi:MAG: UDP-galactose 4-epimerase [Patescibacteria group bacterium]|nr:UDP-galactose 4-epimerase [Patescibacteria group bacterium]